MGKKTTSLLILAAVFVVGAAFLLLSKEPQPAQAPSEKAQATASTSATPAAGLVSASNAAAQPIRPAEGAALTYRPSQPRAVQQYLGPLDENGRPPNWWLYARNEQEVEWLNRYGYPSPAEERKLKAASDADLQKLAMSGDKNAKAHLTARSMKSILENQDVTGASTLQHAVRALLVEGGPYQASTILSAIGENMTTFAKTPAKDRTDQQRKILNQYADFVPQAMFLGEVYGDYSLNGIYNSYPALQVRREFGIDDKRQPHPSSLASLLAANARDRDARGEGPMLISTRYRSGGSDPNRFSGEPGSIILERQ